MQNVSECLYSLYAWIVIVVVIVILWNILESLLVCTLCTSVCRTVFNHTHSITLYIQLKQNIYYAGDNKCSEWELIH